MNAALAEHGFAWIECADDASFVTLATRLGAIVDDTRVQLVEAGRTYLARPDRLPLHTDHPCARFIAWRCEVQDAIDGASVLVDSRAVLRRLDETTLSALRQTTLVARVRSGFVPQAFPVLATVNDEERFFFAPWLSPETTDEQGLCALQALRDAIAAEEAAGRVRIRLQAGQVLVVDNHRVLHGRDAIARESPRRLRRLWIAADHGDR